MNITCITSTGFVMLAALSLAAGCGQQAGRVDEAAATTQPTEAVQPVPDAAFMEAAFNGDAALVAQALKAGSTADLKDEDGRTALMLAAFNGHSAVVSELLEAGADVRPRDGNGRTALMFASTGPDARTVELLLRNGAEVNEADEQEHWTPLMFAAAEGHTEVVRALLAHGADATLKDIDGDNAAAFAAQRGHTGLAALLTEATQ
jgi:ankyrin repeat protein